MRKPASRRAARMAGLLALALVAAAVFVGSSAAASPQMLWASPSGGGSACTAASPCSLDYAVSNAPAGATVRAQSGTYHGGVVIDTPLHLVGTGHSVLDASTSGNGVGIQVTASGSSVEHFTVENAQFEGILVGNSPTEGWGSAVSGVLIGHNVVVDNNQGYGAENAQGECALPPVPGDCGEGIHLVSVTNSVVEHNYITGNAGGILLTDEFGPTAHNVIQHNTAVGNTHDCGITLASHVAMGVPFPTGPYGFGVYENTIQYNVADDNGVQGEGGGILMAGGGPNTKVYGNLVAHNEASGNGLAGVTIHLHVPGSDLHGNVIVFNRLSNNNLDGDYDFDPYVDPETTDILVAAVGPPLTGTVIEHNQLSNAYYGIWTLGVATSTIIAHNHFGPNITTPIFSQ